MLSGPEQKGKGAKHFLISWKDRLIEVDLLWCYFAAG